jgi:hypothetical protein
MGPLTGFFQYGVHMQGEMTLSITLKMWHSTKWYRTYRHLMMNVVMLSVIRA